MTLEMTHFLCIYEVTIKSSLTLNSRVSDDFSLTLEYQRITKRCINTYYPAIQALLCTELAILKMQLFLKFKVPASQILT